MTKRALWLLGSLLIAASSLSAQSNVRDSAGVLVVTSQTPDWSGPPWSIDSTPLAVVGGIDGSVELANVVSPALVPGGFVIPDAVTQTLHRFSDAGEHLWSTGRQGGGPGEFQSLISVHPYGTDSILAGEASRFSVFSADGEFGRTIRVERVGRFGFSYAGSTPGSELILLPSFFSPRPSEVEGLRWVNAPIVASGETGDDRRTVIEVPHHSQRVRGGRPVRDVFRGFGAGAVHDGSIHWSRNDRAEIRTYDSEGALRRIVRWSEEARPASAEVRAQWEAEMRQMFSASPDYDEAALERVMASLRDAEMGDHVPYHGTLLTDPDGFVWLSTYSNTGASAHRWRIFGPDGRWLGWVTAPDGRVVDVSTDRVLILDHDDLDVPVVRVHRLSRPAS